MALVDPNAVTPLLKRPNGAPAPTASQSLKELLDAYDADVRAYRAQRDTTVDPSQPMSAGDIAARLMTQTNDARQDAATGPAGYNRQWAPLIQSLKGKRFIGGGSLPTDTYADPTHSGQMTLQPGKPYDVSTPTVTMPTVTMPRVTMPTSGAAAMPEDQDAFEARYAAKDATAKTASNVLQQRATKPKAQGLPVGRVPTPGPITASPSPPGTPFSLDDATALAPLGASPTPPGNSFSLDALRKLAAGLGASS